MRRTALIVALLVVAYMASCDSNKDDLPVTISFMTGGTRAQKNTTEEIIRRFEKLHPKIKIRLEWGASGDFYILMMTRMVGKVAPDLMFMHDYQAPYFVAKGQLLDLTTYVERDFGKEMAGEIVLLPLEVSSSAEAVAVIDTVGKKALIYVSYNQRPLEILGSINMGKDFRP